MYSASVLSTKISIYIYTYIYSELYRFLKAEV